MGRELLIVESRACSDSSLNLLRAVELLFRNFIVLLADDGALGEGCSTRQAIVSFKRAIELEKGKRVSEERGEGKRKVP